MSKPNKPSRAVREPIQVYLTPDERAILDRTARETGLSRAEVLRRGLRRFAAEQGEVRSPLLQFLKSMADDEWPADLSERHDDHLADAYRDTNRGGDAREETP